MTYYEEFGVTPAATPDQIRKAHHALSRLLHPDRQTDPNLRQMAEIQMRRLNEMAATLLEPKRRQAYDSSLLPAPAPEIQPQTAPRVRPYAVIVIIGVLLTGSVLYVLAGDFVRVQPVALKSIPSPEKESMEIPEPRRTPAVRIKIPIPSRTPYEGLWQYVASRKRTGPDPDYVQLRISNDQGFIHGLYRTGSRLFTFDGAATGNNTSLALRAPNGSEGKIALRIAGPNTLHVDWALDTLNGSAILARIGEP